MTTSSSIAKTSAAYSKMGTLLSSLQASARAIDIKLPGSSRFGNPILLPFGAIHGISINLRSQTRVILLRRLLPGTANMRWNPHERSLAGPWRAD